MEQIQQETEFPSYHLFYSKLKPKFSKRFLPLLTDKIDGKIFKNFGAILSVLGLGLPVHPQFLHRAEVPEDEDVQQIIEDHLLSDPEKYLDSWRRYYHSPSGRRMDNLLQYFQLYNANDVDILMRAWEVFSKKIWDTFGVHVLDSWSLPGLAQKILVQNYPKTQPPVFTFPNKFGFLNKAVRENLVGGFSGPIQKRHVEVGGPIGNFDRSVYFAGNGERYTKIQQVDANSLYPFCMKASMPTGMGLYLQKEGEVFKPELIKEREISPKCSKISLIYYDYLQNEINTQYGPGHLLQCALTTGEKKIGDFFPG